ncbi:cation:dicarboxylase symporter family transporter [Prevotella sp. LMAG:51]|uniref:cation:dicarboxylate symporter family transporter n=1 Tax=Prevotella sp. LMAG:51 TaxID=1969564 RepID=UPI00257BA708|nr:cation:dicarboxylase symporter family transporter [Prevotella sp. LMAG:51]
MNFIATVYTRLFQLLAVPTIALAVMTTLASLGNQADTGKIFRHAITYTLLTTFAAAAVGLVLYNVIAPGNLPAALVQSGMADVPQNLGETSYYDQQILGVIPNNISETVCRRQRAFHPHAGCCRGHCIGKDATK